MNTLPCDLIDHVESGPLPRRVWFYAWRRRIDGMRPVRAFSIGLAVGVWSAVMLLGFLGCQSAALPPAGTLRSGERMKLYSLEGSSMLPLLPEKGLAWVDTGVAFDQIKAGDVVVFVSARHIGRQISHRAFRQVGGAWWCHGDNNPMPDNELVTRENFVGVLLVETARKEET